MNESQNIGKLVNKFGSEKGFDIYQNFVRLYQKKHFREVQELYKSQQQYYNEREEVLTRYVNRMVK